MTRVLLLGGVGDALRLARRLGPEHLYSLAGLGKVPEDLGCRVRVGGFGGAEGLARFIRAEGFDLLLDVTHPYAARISANAVTLQSEAALVAFRERHGGELTRLAVAQAQPLGGFDTWRSALPITLLEAHKP